jgi:hypothetical protein
MFVSTKSTFEGTSFSTFLFRFFSGVAGGLLGTIAALLVFLFFSFASQSSGTHDIWTENFTGAGILAVVFFGSFIANIFSIFFQILSDPKKYPSKGEILKNIFTANLLLFFLFIILYFFFRNHIASIIGLYLFISASASALLAEVSAGKQYAVMGVIGVFFAQIFLFSFFVLVMKEGEMQTMFSVFFLPFVWIFLPIMIFLAEKMRSVLLSAFNYDLFSFE